MIKNILIITDDKKNISFNSIVALHHLTIISLKDLGEFDSLSTLDYSTAIIDIENVDELLLVCNLLRNTHKWLPLLLIVGNITKSYNSYFKKIQGYGQIKLHTWRELHPDELLNSVQELLYPQYPVTSSKIALVLPVYNEEARFNHVCNFVKKLRNVLDNVYSNINIYFVNDGSSDNTQLLINQLMEDDSSNSQIISYRSFISYCDLSINTRKAGTYIEGMKSITADILIFVDADDSFNINDISLMINILKNGYYDIVIGSKDYTAENRSLIRKFLSFGKRALTKPLLPKGVYDSQTGLKAMTASAANHIVPYLNITSELAIDLELLYVAKKLNFRVLQTPVTCIDREGSHVNIIKDSLTFLKIILKLIKTKYKF